MSKLREAAVARRRAHYEKNRAAEIARATVNRNIRRNRIAELKMVPCADCGFFPKHHSQMDFDHRPGENKTGTITSLLRHQGLSLAKVLEEIEKCDIVCANCHRLRTINRIMPA